jgi:hypothetical protein
MPIWSSIIFFKKYYSRFCDIDLQNNTYAYYYAYYTEDPWFESRLVDRLSGLLFV